MDRITKYIKKLSKKDTEKISIILEKIKEGNVEDLDIRKLKGHDNIFRVRAGKQRIIYQINNSRIKLLDVSKRNENTYK